MPVLLPMLKIYCSLVSHYTGPMRGKNFLPPTVSPGLLTLSGASRAEITIIMARTVYGVV